MQNPLRYVFPPVPVGFTVNAGKKPDFTVVKLDGARGVELWRYVIGGTAFGFDNAHAVTVDGAGDVVAAGRIVNTGTSDDFTVVKFAGVSGTELWHQVINGTANGVDRALSVAVDSMGNVVATGVTTNTGTGADFTVIKFDGMSGTELWRKTINSTANDFDTTFAVTVDGAGNVVAAGMIKNVGTGDDFIVVKLSGADGSNF